MMQRDALMTGAPVPTDQQVTLANWRQSPFSRWAFHHVGEIIPSAVITTGPTRPLQHAPCDLAAVAFEDADGRERTFGSVMAESWTTGLVVLHRGTIVTESYFPGYSGAEPHIVFSISKSITSMVAGILCDRDLLDPSVAVSQYIPETDGSAYGDCTIQNLLDMTVSCTFEEVYLEPDGDYAKYRSSTGWNPPLDHVNNWVNPGMRAFLLTLKKGDDAHGEVFNYLSPNSDMLGWVLERASGVRFADLARDLLWRPIGAETSAIITVDHLGAPRTAGGICVTVRDLARLGELMRLGGQIGGQQVLSGSWIHETLHQRNDAAWARGDLKSLLPHGGYRNKWYQTGNPSGAFCGIGIHGQWLYVDPQAEMVIARVAAQPEPVDEPLDHLHVAAFDAVARHLEGAH